MNNLSLNFREKYQDFLDELSLEQKQKLESLAFRMLKNNPINQESFNSLFNSLLKEGVGFHEILKSLFFFYEWLDDKGQSIDINGAKEYMLCCQEARSFYPQAEDFLSLLEMMLNNYGVEKAQGN